MAIIKCPECGEPVSSTTNHCVHCGYSFTVCPECGKIESGEISICKNCGYEIKKNLFPQTENVYNKNKFNTSEYLDSNLQTVFFTVTKSARVIKSSRKFVLLISLLLGIALMIFAFVDLFKWNPKTVFEIPNQGSVLDSVNILFAFSIVFFVIYLLYDWFSFYGLIFFFGKWIKDYQVDYITYLKYNSTKSDLDKTVNGYDMTAQASCVAYSKNMQNFILVRLIVIAFTLILSSIFLFKAIDLNVQAYIVYKLQNSISNSTTFAFDYVYIIVAAVLWGVHLIVNKYIMQSIYKNKVDKWIFDVLAK